VYKPKKSSSYGTSYRHAEDYANQTGARPQTHNKHSDIVTEEYHAEYVRINPDTDKPDEEAFPIDHDTH